MPLKRTKYINIISVTRLVRVSAENLYTKRESSACFCVSNLLPKHLPKRNVMNSEDCVLLLKRTLVTIIKYLPVVLIAR